MIFLKDKSNCVKINISNFLNTGSKKLNRGHRAGVTRTMTPRMLHIVIARTATEYVRNGVQVFEHNLSPDDFVY
jgi:hypothetical protein